MVSPDESVEVNTGANPSQEEQEEQCDMQSTDTKEKVCNLAKIHRLTKQSYDKKSYIADIKKYVKEYDSNL